MEQTKKRGGTREGAGRKRLGDEPRQYLSTTVSAATAQKLKEGAKANGLSIGQYIDKIINQ